MSTAGEGGILSVRKHDARTNRQYVIRGMSILLQTSNDYEGNQLKFFLGQPIKIILMEINKKT